MKADLFLFLFHAVDVYLTKNHCRVSNLTNGKKTYGLLAVFGQTCWRKIQLKCYIGG